MTDYLSPQELADLTGSPQHVRQTAWLRRSGWKFVVALDGRPRVLRAYRDKRLGVGQHDGADVIEPDWTQVA